jgi:hypothetical protein
MTFVNLSCIAVWCVSSICKAPWLELRAFQRLGMPVEQSVINVLSTLKQK